MKRPNTIRMSEEAWAALDRMATLDTRSMAAWVECMVKAEALKRGTWVPRKLTAIAKSE